MIEEVAIKTPFINLGQMLKFVGLIDNGSLSKFFLTKTPVKVNGVDEARRGRKLYPGDEILIMSKRYKISGGE